MTDHRKNFVISMVSYAVQRDISREKLCRLSGIDLASLQRNNEAGVTSEQLSLLWENAIYLSKDPHFGLHFGEVMQLSALGIIGAIIRNSATIGDALQQCATYTYLLTDLFDMKVIRGGDKFSVRLMKPEMVTLPHDKKERAEYGRVLRCSRLRAADDYYMEFNGILWDEPIHLANYELQTVLLGYADKYKYVMDGKTSVTTKITHLLKKNSYLGAPGMKEVAANLHISTRSLQRKLREEGVTYQELVESVKRSLALHYMDTGHHRAKEVAHMLGYSRLSGFTRAFKQWTGKTPSEYRKEG